MSLERIRLLVDRWRERVAATRRSSTSRSARRPALGRELLESMLLARHLDVAAHELRAAGHGHYTICSSGHEANVVLGRLTKPTDPSMVHYRSGALQIERARQAPEVDAVQAIARSLVASSLEPASGGRHKVFGHRALGILPQTSTIASHLPRAVGLAFALDRRRRLQIQPNEPSTAPVKPDEADDSIVLASFGDASINHSTWLGAVNAAGWAAHQGIPMPLLLVCEDNGLGISVPSPPGWVAARLRALPHVEYFHADGWDLHDTWQAARAAVEHCRTARRPAVLHLCCVRLLGHAGSDVDTAYREAAELERILELDPVLRAAIDLIETGAASADELLALDRRASERVRAEARRAVLEPKLRAREEILRPIATPAAASCTTPARAGDPVTDPAAPGAEKKPLTLAQGVNAALREALASFPEILVFGEDVARKGGVYGVTRGLLDAAGPARVFDTLLDEQTILGLALGAANAGLLPIPEIQYLAYLHNAEDQIRGEAATLPFFTNATYDNPMIVRIASFAYQKGFGGHFHNDNSIAVLRDVPGIVLAVPARADDAVELYRAALSLAREARRVVVVLEPIALYHERDLHRPGDGLWLAAAGVGQAPIGRARVHGDGRDLTIATFGNGVPMSLRTARWLSQEHGIDARVVDLRWLAPLPVDDLLYHARETGRLLFVDECRCTGSTSEAVAAAVLDSRAPIRFARVTAADSFIPLGDAARLVLVSEDEIGQAALALAAER